MDSIFRRTGSFFLVSVLIIFLGLAGCENPGSVGGDIGESRAEVVIDTLALNSLTSRSVNYYSGSFAFFSAGAFNDPVLGDITATGLIKPSLPAASDDTLTNDSKMLMRIILEDSQVYGDSLAGQSFDIYEVDEPWRGQAVKLKDNLKLDEANGPIASFTIGEEDSIDVEMPSDWVEKYRGYASEDKDSLYRFEQHGFALVPTNSNKIIAPSASPTRFVVQNPEADTFDVSLNQWAYTLDRDNSGSLPAGSLAWHSTNESMLGFDVDLSVLGIQATDISNAELVLYQNNELMDSSLESEPASVDRAEETTAQLYAVDPDGLPDNIIRTNPLANGFYSDNDGAFHFSFTSQVQNLLESGLPAGREFVITLSNNGIIKSSIIYTAEASSENKPKLIITSLKNSSN